MLPGLRLRQVRERLGLTYRDVERASMELAERRGRPEFVLHIGRLADIENRNAVPGLHKMYSLCVIYHLNPAEIFTWFDVPLDKCFEDSVGFPAPLTHKLAAPSSLRLPLRFDPSFDPARTAFLSRMIERWGQLEGILMKESQSHCYGFIGLLDQRMVPLLRPGSVVLVDTSVRDIEETDWVTEHDRPMYFVDVRTGYRCGWFYKHKGLLVMQPHPLSRTMPESWRYPEDAEIVGRVVGVVTRFTDFRNPLPESLPEAPEDSSRTDP